MPLLVRTVTSSEKGIGLHIGMLYCINTLGAALGCLAAGFWMIDTLGLKNTNFITIGTNVVIALVILILSKQVNRISNPDLSKADQNKPIINYKPKPGSEPNVPGWLLLSVTFFNGFIGLACEVLWIRYLAFIDNVAYVFPTILCIYLLGIGLGGLLYSIFANRIQHQVKLLGLVEILLALSVMATFTISALIFASGPPRPMELKGMTFVTVFIPTVLMGFAFPLLCTIYGDHLQTLGRKIGKIYAINTVGTVIGSLLPMFFLISFIGIQKSLFLLSILSGIIGISLLATGIKNNKIYTVMVTGGYVITLLLFNIILPNDLCQRVFRATNFNLGKQTDILFYHEGQTGTSIVAQNNLNKCKTIYINGVSEVPVLYAHQLCFKLIGDLGPMLHPNPDDVLMICFGGGIAAGATSCLPEVKRLTVVDIESSVIESAKLLSTENNNLLQNTKVQIVVDDGRNYLFMGRRKWPVIISDSTHPKSSDSWVLYTRDFYRLVRERLTDDGVFVEWVPMHDLHSIEFKIIVRTFLSVFPHTSLWVAHGIDEQGSYVTYSLLAATIKPLKIDVSRLRERLSEAKVRNDLEPFGLHTPSGFLSNFICAGDTLKNWVGEGPVNTDDLPYTQYETKYTDGPMLEPAEFIEPMENIWPYLINTGQSPNKLYDELVLQNKVNRSALIGRTGEAYTVIPDNIRYLRMKRLYENRSDYVMKLTKLYWENPRALVYIATSWTDMPGGINSTIPIYEQVLKLDPDNVSALNILGIKNMNEGRLQIAENYLKRAVYLDPEFSAAWFNLGLVMDKTGKHTEALKNWYKAALDPDFKPAAEMIGLCLAMEGRLSEAIPWFRRALKVEPVSIETRFNLALALFQIGNKKEALNNMHYVLKMDPENKDALNMVAKMNEQEKNNIMQ